MPERAIGSVLIEENTEIFAGSELDVHEFQLL